jgi:hypothetical protein
MAVEPSLLPGEEPQYQLVWDALEWIFQIIYTFEMIIKIIAHGLFFENHSYLSDSWNVLDFVIVIVSWIQLATANTGISVFRAVRILRTMRALAVFPDLQNLIVIMLKILPQMGNICWLCLVTVVVFAAIGMQLFSGFLNHRCVLESTILDPPNFNTEVWLQQSEYE